MATLSGLAIGYGAARLLQAAEQRDAIKNEWRLVYTVALALFVDRHGDADKGLGFRAD